MKIIFLDIDGVLNVPAAEVGFHYCMGAEWSTNFHGRKRQNLSRTWSPSSLYNLRRIIEATQAHIVISSTWRMGASLADMKSWFQCPVIQSQVFDKTPVHRDDPRGLEIQAWLDKHEHLNIERFAIIDDDSDMAHLMSHFFKTFCFDGLLWKEADEIIKYLNQEET